MIAPHRPLTTPYGTDTFAAHLAAREAALGITQTTQDITQANSAIGLCDGDADTPDAAPPSGDMGVQAVRCDAWGNAITSAPRLDSAYTFTSRTWESGGRMVYVCGSPAAHVAGGYWRLDRRMERGQGMICAKCWCYESGLYGLYGLYGVEGR